jgi:integrase
MCREAVAIAMKYSSAFVRKNRENWYGVLSYKTYETVDGEEVEKWNLTSHKLDATTKQDAKRELSEWWAEMERQAEAEADEDERRSRTVAEYVNDYIDRLADSEAIERTTVLDYRKTANKIAAGFKGVRLQDLKPDMVQRWEARLLKKGQAPSTVGKAHRLLKQAMKDAVNLDIIPKNPVDPVKPPKRKRPHPNALDLDGRTRLLTVLDAMQDTPVTMAARIALYTGMREGEVCGLRWADVDLETDGSGRPTGGTISVCRSIGDGEKGTYLKQPKTGHTRDVPIPAYLADALGRWRSVVRAEAMAGGATFPGEIYVIGDVDGNWYLPHTLGVMWHDLVRPLGIKGTEGRFPTFHDLRHTFATQAIAAGVDVKTVSSILGHANAAMTLNVYASADPDAKRRAAKVIDDSMRRAPAEVRQLDRTGTND